MRNKYLTKPQWVIISVITAVSVVLYLLFFSLRASGVKVRMVAVELTDSVSLNAVLNATFYGLFVAALVALCLHNGNRGRGERPNK